ncbi:oligopeptide/dipeptide ABC transporter ATP-binding protein [Streptomyces sp. NPDC006638]|uniref:oligopeptide/dipeptide ABC transporter ATP-binding protein n=1 Tax=Streptomyces sp. NPDC006638 TaxID=3157183 RepID=UPI0033BCC251
MAATPQPDGAGRLPAELPGDVPDPPAPPSGRRFHPRCPLAFEGCDREDPQVIDIFEDLAVAATGSRSTSTAPPPYKHATQRSCNAPAPGARG